MEAINTVGWQTLFINYVICNKRRLCNATFCFLSFVMDISNFTAVECKKPLIRKCMVKCLVYHTNSYISFGKEL